ncbi:MAG: hypothetical protein AB1505_04220 [Candidatus Latescibacterota bacterium]
MWRPWPIPVQVGVLLVFLLAMGAGYHMRVTPLEQRELELEAGLEQLYHMEAAYFAEHGRYFDPTNPSSGLQWKWMRRFTWEFHASGNTFWLTARADLDEDGQPGMWSVDARGPHVRRVVDD